MKRSLVKPAAGATAVLLLSLTAAACSSSSSSSTSGGSSATGGSTGGSTTGKNYKMTFIQGVAGDGFYVTMGCGIQAEAKKVGNVTVNIQGPTQFDATLQNPIIQSVTAAKPDAILIAPNDVSASRPPIAAAMAAGIKVVLVDTTLASAPRTSARRASPTRPRPTPSSSTWARSSTRTARPWPPR
jgi:ribose transport system substrate-binding protein